MKMFKFKFRFKFKSQGVDVDRWIRYLRFIGVKFDNPYKDAK